MPIAARNPYQILPGKIFPFTLKSKTFFYLFYEKEIFGGQEYPCCGTKIQTRNCLLRGGCKPTWYSPLGKNQQCLRDCLHFMLFSLFNSIVFYNVSIGKAIIAKGKGWSGVLETLESKIHLIRGSNARSQRRENPGPQQIPPISINPENTNKGQKTVTWSSDVVISHTKSP